MKKQKQAKKPVLKGEPAFIYTSTCCWVRAMKTPCFAFGMKSKEAETQGLGTFRCSQCSRPCKCTRMKTPKKGEE